MVIPPMGPTTVAGPMREGLAVARGTASLATHRRPIRPRRDPLVPRASPSVVPSGVVVVLPVVAGGNEHLAILELGRDLVRGIGPRQAREDDGGRGDER